MADAAYRMPSGQVFQILFWDFWRSLFVLKLLKRLHDEIGATMAFVEVVHAFGPKRKSFSNGVKRKSLIKPKLPYE